MESKYLLINRNKCKIQNIQHIQVNLGKFSKFTVNPQTEEQ